MENDYKKAKRYLRKALDLMPTDNGDHGYTKPMSKYITVKLDDETMAKLDKLAKKSDEPVSRVARKLIQDGIEK